MSAPICSVRRYTASFRSNCKRKGRKTTDRAQRDQTTTPISPNPIDVPSVTMLEKAPNVASDPIQTPIAAGMQGIPITLRKRKVKTPVSCFVCSTVYAICLSPFT